MGWGLDVRVERKGMGRGSLRPCGYREKDERLTCNPTAALFNPCNVPPPGFPFIPAFPAATVGPIPGGAYPCPCGGGVRLG